ncbi:MAG: TATA-box-binding protein [Candidatus Thorarchaeota archaeon]|nr:TATA-box-binding protein [Candidatus Thorarchaeota archaeon]
MPRPKPKTKIENVVASVILKQRLDLDEIAATMPNVEFDPEQFPGLVYRLKKPKTATLIFNSGKMVCTGAKSEKEARRAVHKIVKNIREAGIEISGKPLIVVQNIVASASLGAELNLELAAMKLENTLYEPEQFPGLIYRMRDPKVVILLFGSGKLVITGAKFEPQIDEAAEKVMDRLLQLGVMRIPEGEDWGQRAEDEDEEEQEGEELEEDEEDKEDDEDYEDEEDEDEYIHEG